MIILDRICHGADLILLTPGGFGLLLANTPIHIPSAQSLDKTNRWKRDHTNGDSFEYLLDIARFVKVSLANC